MQKRRPTCSQEHSVRDRANCLALVYNHGFPKAAGVKPPTNYSDLTEALQVPIGRQRAAWGWHVPDAKRDYPAAAGVEAFTVSRFASHRITTEQTRNDGRQR